MYKRQPIDLAIVDVMMPVMDGITMTAKLREKYDFPVIFLAAKTEAVSYTHLDVYKRQVLYCVLPFL